MLLFGCKPIVNWFAFHPDNTDVIQENKLPLGVEEFAVVTEDGISIKSLYLPAAGSDKVLIYFHGNAGNIYHRIPSLLKLQGFGLNVVGVSYRGYGKSEGKPSEEGLYLDGKAILRYIRKDLGFSDKNIIIFGRSIGTTVAINTVDNNELGGLVLVAPLTRGLEQAKASGFSLFSSLAGNSFDNITKIKSINVPVLVVHGTKDRVIPYSMGQAIFNAAPSKKEFITIEGAGHNDLHNYGKEYWEPIYDFLNDKLPTQASPVLIR